ncbi:hypothetical protein FE82_14855, partial [Staphylococcus aureus]
MQDHAALGRRVQRHLLGVGATARPFDVARQPAAVEHAALFGFALPRIEAVPVGELGGALQPVGAGTGIIHLADRIG